VRHTTPQVQYCGAFYGQTVTGEALDEAISVDSLINIFRNLPPGITELGCHPGFADRMDTMYIHQRSVEVATLCSPKIVAALMELEIELLSFHDMATPVNPQTARHSLRMEASI
jgi:predicted glycoside hydrolase/deacetylase ChbG (UPF0249 family)